MEKELAIEQIKERIESELENVKSELNPSKRDQRMNHYLNSYCSLLKVSQSLCKQAKADPSFRNNAIAAIAHMAYGWMPTTLKRHSTAMTILTATRDIRKVSLWLGHADIKTTEMYLRASPTDKLEVLEAVTPPSIKPGKFPRARDELMEILYRT